jgi:hypothetical protein
MAVAEAAMEGAGKAAAAEMKTAAPQVETAEVASTEMSATEMAPAAVPSAPSRLRARRSGEGQHRCKQRCEDDGTSANSVL